MTRRSVSDRFIEQVRRGPSGCWEWIGVRDRKNYGNFSWRNVDGSYSTKGAHRVAWELFRGPIPAEYEIDHLCRNHGCVNPMHLQPVTKQENLLRGRTKYARAITKTHCPAGHPYSGDNLVIRKNGYRRCRACHAEKQRERRKRGRRVDADGG